MGTEDRADPDSTAQSADTQNPFGLSTNQLFVLAVLGGLLAPGFAVYFLERAGLPTVADVVWVVGYGAAVLSIWYFWLRPRDLVGSTEQRPTLPDESDDSGTDVETRETDAETTD